MLKNVILSVSAASALVFAMSADAAAKTGFYVGAEAGYGYSDLEKLSGSQTIDLAGNTVTAADITTNKGGFDGRAYVGYRISQYFGVELGGEYLPHSNYKFTATANGVTINPKITLEQYSFDMLVKGFIPFNDQFFGFVGAGPAYVLNKYEVSDTVVGGSVSSDYQGYVRPKATAGLGYNINSNLALTVSYGHIFGDCSGTDLLNGKRGVVDVNTFTTGVQYTF